MAEYWKSIPKKYCDFCKVWFQDNKSSVDFHEKGFKHQANVRKHLTNVRKRGTQKEKEQNQYDAEMRKIEQAALVAYEKDLIAAGKTPTGLIKTKKPPIKEESDDQYKSESQSRYGESTSGLADKSKQETLEMISKKQAKRAEWYESKTVEGKVYYYNRVTYVTRWDEPKCGFISLEEQKTLNISDIPGDQSSKADESKTFKHQQYGKWETIESQFKNDVSPASLQLPERCEVAIKRKAPEARVEEEEAIEFVEKTVQLSGNQKSKNDIQFGFKKRKTTGSRNMRTRTDD